MWKKIVFILVFTANLILAQDKEFSSPELISYQTNKIHLQSNLPPAFSKNFLEYAEGFSILIYQFLAELKNEDSEIKINIKIFNSCGDFGRYLSANSIPTKGTLYFRELQSKSWTEFSISGCYSNSNFFFHSFQHRLVESFLNDKNKEFPIWFKQGILEYFENSSFLIEDESIVPILKDDYLRRLKQLLVTLKKDESTLTSLLKMEKKEWFKNSKFYYPYSWAFFWYLFDVHPNGRNIIKKYISNIEYLPNKKIDLEKTYENVFSFLGKRDTISSKELEMGFHQWLNNLPMPLGYNHFLALADLNVPSTKIKLMQIALDENKNYYLYYQQMAQEYYSLGKYAKSLEYAEKAIDLEIKDGTSIKTAINASFQIGQFNKTEYYIWIAKELKIDFKSFKDILQSTIDWRISNQDTPLYVPEIKFP
jgi:hypothetical protein